MAAHQSSCTSRDSVAYVNGLVYTVDDEHPWIEAFIVSHEGIFIATGSSADIRAQAKQYGLVVYDLHGQFIMPGIHDAHIHILSAGRSLLSEIPLADDTTTQNLAERIANGSCSCAYAHAYGDWFRASTLAIPDFDRSCLDEKFPDTPVYIGAGAGHNLYLNTAALKTAGYDVDNEPESQAARFVRREDNSLTGEVSEMGMNKAAIALPKPPISHVKRALLAGMREAHKAGVTSFQEASATGLMLAAFAELEKEGRLNMDVFGHMVDAPEWLGGAPREELQANIDIADRFNSAHVNTNFVKFILDGIPLPPILSHAGLDESGRVDESKIMVSDLAERILIHDARGRTIKVHCAGHGSVRMTLDAFELARKQNPNGPRHEIAHCNSIHPDDLNRFKQLNVTAEMSPAFFFGQPLAAAAPESFDWKFNELSDQQTLVTVGSDWGGGWDPCLFPYCARIVKKLGKGSKEAGGRFLCKLMTLAGAEAVGKKSQFGSIEVGKKANFIAVSRNLANGEFEEAKVLKTWFEGEIVWEEKN